jgi:hypothetical protein
MPKVIFNAQFVSYIRDHEVDLTDEEYADLKSGKKKYWDFIDDSDSVEGEWTEGWYDCWETDEPA